MPLGIRTAVFFRWHEGDEIFWCRAQQDDLIPSSQMKLLICNTHSSEVHMVKVSLE